MAKERKRVGIWVRVSTDDQALGDSPAHHEKRARAYAEAKDWTVVEVYRLEGVSGKAVMEHPEMTRMLEHVRTGHISGLLFSKLARLARSTKHLLDLADIFREHDADLVSLQESIDTASPAGLLFFTIIAAMAQWEREEIAERVAASIPVRAQLGKNLGGAASFGYRWEGHNLIPDPDEAPVRKLVYELFLEHRRKKTVARVLNERGYRTRKGAKFSDTTITRLLRDPTAKGKRRANYTKSPGINKQWQLKPEDEWVWVDCEPIVSEELWDQCNTILDEQTKTRKPGRKPRHVFAGRVLCHCGGKMYVPSNTPKYVCYDCRNKIPVDDLEALFHEQLRDFVSSPDEVANYLSMANDEIAEMERLLEALPNEQRDLQRQMDRWSKAFMDDEISQAAFAREYRPLDERYQQIEDELPRLQAELDVLKIDYLSSDKILSEAADLFTQWPSMELEARRALVEAVVDTITIGKEDVSIDLIALPSFGSGDYKATPEQGFIAAINWNRAG